MRSVWQASLLRHLILTLKVNFLGTTRCEICSIRSYTDGTYNIFRSPQTLQYDELLLYVVLAADICLRYKLNTQWCGSEKSRFVSKGKIYIFIMCHFNLLTLDNKVIRTGNHIILSAIWNQ